MVNCKHFNVLFKKNLLTLRRKWGFALFFVILPIISMGIFTAIKYAISKGIKPEGHNFDCNTTTILTSLLLLGKFSSSCLPFRVVLYYQQTAYLPK